MPPLRYLGTPYVWDETANPNDLVTQSYINTLLANNISSGQVTTQITNDLASYATNAYATTQMAGLATPAYTAAAAANYVHSSTINQINGPVGLDSITGKVSVGQINGASTQQWPSPFWSPAAYQAASVSATTTPAQLYTVAIPYPGYTYTLMCFGQVDTSVATDNGTFAEVLVRVGSTTGQIVAFGYGSGESYPGPAPGQVAAQAFLNTPSTFTAGYTAIPGWVAFNSGGFSSVMVGNFLQVPQTMTATLSATVGFGAGTLGVASKNSALATSIRIVNNTGTVLATGATVGSGSGTCVVSTTAAVVGGQLYGIQGQEKSPDPANADGSAFASIDNGTFTISPAQVTSASIANIIPVPFEDQTPLTAATTLYVMLASSNSSTQVTASTFLPSLYIVPIPWI